MQHNTRYMISFDIKLFSELVEKHNKILVTSHFSPDGDAIGSLLGLGLYLKKLGKTVLMAVPNDFPNFLKWMPEHDSIIIYENEPEKLKTLSQECGLAFILDYNNLSRIKDMADIFDTEKQDIVLIDHHQQPDNFTLNISHTDASSTCELVAQILWQYNADLIDADIADCLYTGLVTDTGSFKYNSTTALTHELGAKLMEKGARAAFIQEKINNSGSFKRLRLIGYALSEKMEMLANNKVCLISLSKEELERYDYQKGDTEGLVNYGLSIEGVIMAVFIREDENLVKMSFRCVGEMDVNQFARTYFNGGGHIRAAGGASEKSLPETIADFKAAVSEIQDQLK